MKARQAYEKKNAMYLELREDVRKAKTYQEREKAKKELREQQAKFTVTPRTSLDVMVAARKDPVLKYWRGGRGTESTIWTGPKWQKGEAKAFLKHLEDKHKSA